MSELQFAVLARAREAAGMSLEEAARQLKFAPRQLQALEAGELERLPGGTFVRGMLRSYARLLHVEVEPLLAQIGERVAPPDAERLAERYRQPVPFSDGARRSTFVYLAMSLGVLVLVGGVAYEWHLERTAAAQKATTVAKAKSSPRSEEVRPAAVAPVPVQQAAAPVVTPKVIAPETTTLAAAPASPPRTGAHRLVVRTEGEAWIEIKDASDRMLVSSLNPPGSERVVRGKPPYSLVIGNASQVIITYDDKPVNLAPHTRQDVARFTLP